MESSHIKKAGFRQSNVDVEDSSSWGLHFFFTETNYTVVLLCNNTQFANRNIPFSLDYDWK